MKKTVTILSLLLALIPIGTASELVLARNGQAKADIIIPHNAPSFTQEAARKLADYLEQTSGATFSISENPQDSSKSLIWVGFRPEIAQKYPHADFTFQYSEEILIQATNQDLIIMGRDTVEHDQQVEAGTYHAVSTFIQDKLNVRWFWPGELGTDVPRQETLSFQPFHFRYHPRLQWRMIPMQQFERRTDRLADRSALNRLLNNQDSRKWARERDLEVREWMIHQRSHTKAEIPLAGTQNYWGMHYFGKRRWWDRFGKEHPEWFALQPDGTRTPFPTGATAKMCVSNPGVAEQWLKEAIANFEKNPHLKMVAAAENDYGWQGYCVCEACAAWDNKEAPMLERDLIWATEKRPSRALTDRYVKFWNHLAVELRKAFPDREAYVSIWAYHATRPAPSTPLEENIIVGFVGLEKRFYQENNMESVLKDRETWKQWWEASGKRNNMVWRPNLMARNAGAMPYVFMHRHAENMRFLADHGLGGLHWNSLSNHWATQGPQHYLNAQLAWNPYLDPDEILEDYYHRAFGPAAPHLRDYFSLFEEHYRLLAEQYKGVTFSTYSDPPKIFREMRTDGKQGRTRLGREGITRNNRLEKRARHHLELARQKVSDPDSPYRRRIEFISSGLDFVVAQLDCMEALNDLREKKDNPDKLRVNLAEAIQRRYEILRDNQTSFAIDLVDILSKLEGYSEFLGTLEPLPEESNPDTLAPDEQALQDDLEA